MEYGLVLTSGGIRDVAHVDVLKALGEARTLPSAVTGINVSSVIIRLYASGMSISKMEKVIKYLSGYGNDYLDPDYAGLLGFVSQLLAGMNVSLSSLIRGKRLLAYFNKLTGGKQLDESIVKFVIPAVNLVSGKTPRFTNIDEVRDQRDLRWVQDGYLYEVMMASSSVPAIFFPLETGNYRLVGRGVTDNLPENLLQETGIRTIISVDVGGRYYASSGGPILEAVAHSFSIMSERLKAYDSNNGTPLLKPPPPEKAGLLTSDQMMVCMETGYQCTREMIPEVEMCLFRGS